MAKKLCFTIDRCQYHVVLQKNPFPNWWNTLPMPVAAFMEHYDWKGKYIVPFCTSEGS